MQSIPEDSSQGAVLGMAIALGCKRPGTSRKAAARGVAPLDKGEGHSQRGAPCGQPLSNSLHPQLFPGRSTKSICTVSALWLEREVSPRPVSVCMQRHKP